MILPPANEFRCNLMCDVCKKGLLVAAEKAEYIRWHKRVTAAELREAAHNLKRLGARNKAVPALMCIIGAAHHHTVPKICTC